METFVKRVHSLSIKRLFIKEGNDEYLISKKPERMHRFVKEETEMFHVLHILKETFPHQFGRHFKPNQSFSGVAKYVLYIAGGDINQHSLFGKCFGFMYSHRKNKWLKTSVMFLNRLIVFYALCFSTISKFSTNENLLHVLQRIISWI